MSRAETGVRAPSSGGVAAAPPSRCPRSHRPHRGSPAATINRGYVAGLASIVRVTGDIGGPGDPGKLRASDADREAVVQALHAAMAEGRLTPAELQERVGQAYAAKTISELDPLTRDLPGHAEITPLRKVGPAIRPVSAPLPADARIGGQATSSVAVGVMSGTTRRGAWVVPEQFTAVAVMGGIDLDLTRARFAQREVTITALTLMGGIDIVVPPDITVIVSGVGFMGAIEDNAQVQGPAGGVVVRINGFAMMGGVDVHRPKKKRDEIEE